MPNADRLHVLVNLGGAVNFEKHLTPEGFGQTFAVNYLSNYLLTIELLDILKASKPARVITVAGAPRFLKHAKINFDDIQSLQHFSGLGALAQSMFARTFFSFALAQRLQGSGVSSLVFHPGFIKSDLARNAPWTLKLITSLMNGRGKEVCDIL